MATLIQEVHPDLWGLGALPLGLALELAIGDPKGWPHPVRGIGRLIVRTEGGLRVAVARAGGGPDRERLAGLALTILVVGFVASVAWFLSELCGQFGGPATLIGRGLLIYWGLAIRSLAGATLRASESPDLPAARTDLSTIIGRDATKFDLDEVRRTCVETIGEEANKSIIGPLFWLAVAGPGGLWAYKAIDILNSKVGHKTPRHLHFGRTSARLDDLANYLPARLTWLLIALSAAILGEDGGAALRIGRRDARKHPSLKAVWGQAAIAGALGVQLGGTSTYGGVPIRKPLLGDQLSPIDRTTVRKAVRIMVIAALNAAFLAWTCRILLLSSLDLAP